MRKWMIGLVAVMAWCLASGASAQTPPARSADSPAAVGPNFVDEDGDGICDRFQAGGQGQGQGRRRGGKGYGPRNGTGTGVGPQDGSGYGARAGAGSAGCDGTGPKGRGRRGRR